MYRRFFTAVALFSIVACSAQGGNSVVPFGSSQSAAAVSRAGIDLGPRAASDRVSLVVALRYNHERELERFVKQLAVSRTPHYLTHAQFVARYSATPAQQETVLRALRRAGFKIDRVYANRAIVDASAPAAAVDRFFSTQIHDFRQARYGVRYAPVLPLRVPSQIRSLVSVVDADSRVLMHSDLKTVYSGLVPSKSTANVVKNAGFESGKLKPWTTCRSAANVPSAIVTRLHPHSGKFDGYAGTLTGKPEPNGSTSLCQEVTIPNSATLRFYTWGVNNDAAKNVYQFAALYDGATGKLVKYFYKQRRNDTAWRAHSVALASYSGQTDFVAFGVNGDKAHKGKAIGQFVDDVTLTGAAGCATTAARYPRTTATPTPNAGPNNGWGPGAIANALYMPSNYGYTGATQTVAIVIDATVAQSDLNTYLQQFCITPTGTVTYVPVDGGGNNTPSQAEAALDLETIVGLAPDANVRVYNIPSLSNTDVEDAYNQILTDNMATVVNSSFGGCEANNTSYDSMTNQLAMQGLTTGVTFAASSGDQGSDCFNGSSTYPVGVNAPASDVYFTAVGGTQSTATTGYCPGAVPTSPANPVAWNDCVDSGGGGVSTVWTPPPSWQVSEANVTTSGRSVPDIALPAAYASVYVNGQWTMNWGTSWSSPIFVAMQAEINQACGHVYSAVHTTYGDYNVNGYKDFIDVTSGNNLWVKSTYSQSYTAGVGFDQVSGIGIPLGMLIARDYCGVAIPAIPASRR